jgi:hypothetical protein
LVGVGALAVVFVLGWRTRIVSILLFLGVLSIHQRLILVDSGADTLIMCMTFCAMLSPCGAAYSLDARREARKRGGTLAEPLIVPWAQRLIQFQIALLYFMTAALKCNGRTWAAGTSIYYVMHNPDFNRFTLGVGESPLILNALAHGTVWLEFALAFLLWFRGARPYVIAGGVALHATILLTVNIPLFGEMAMASYVTFMTAPELDGLLRALNPAGWYRRAASALATLGNTRAEEPSGALRGPHFARNRRPAPSARRNAAQASDPSDSPDRLASAVGR